MTYCGEDYTREEVAHHKRYYFDSLAVPWDIIAHADHHTDNKMCDMFRYVANILALMGELEKLYFEVMDHYYKNLEDE